MLFYENLDAAPTLALAKNTDDLIARISVLTQEILKPGRTLIFLDEVQQCQDLLTWVKFLTGDKGYDVILSASLLRIDAFAHVRSLPVGFLTIQTMYPLTFEEFSKALGTPPLVWDEARSAISQRIPVPDYIHNRLMDQFRNYLIVGGMPQVVQAYIDAPQPTVARELQRDICISIVVIFQNM